MRRPPIQTIMDINNMKIADVLLLPEYCDEMAALVGELGNSRKKAREDAKIKKYKLVPHAIDRLIDKGVWEPGKMTVLFAEVLDKKAVGYSVAERKFIRECGIECFNKTIEKLAKCNPAIKEAINSKRNEKTGNNNNGNHKQQRGIGHVHGRVKRFL